ncbi:MULTISPECIES: alpha/beta hydrolase [unclassified Rhizobium]|uniref:alpha/beta hydrolase n=1 Tax=unclassified Rhizobium TaxID=2613769 RepID=UPI001ADB93D4|nr:MULTISPECIES: esterase [unclassified Rhizobium]MBO9124408.1 esterase [Rhizobium sp. 16-488-2b]MBO9174944.1 esterase [Rhizobium sp. 16-488-2a]
MPDLKGFHYRATSTADAGPPLLLLHGSSRDETELPPLAETAAPGWPYLSLRGPIPWESGYAFFRRNPDRTLDQSDLALQTGRLRTFLQAAIETGLIARPPILFGFSNGAIIAASLMIRDPDIAAGAILVRPLSLDPDAIIPSMPAKPVLILSGDRDDRRSPEDATRIASQFQAAGADVTSHSSPTDHHLHDDEPAIIGQWLASRVFPLAHTRPPL